MLLRFVYILLILMASVSCTDEHNSTEQTNKTLNYRELKKIHNLNIDSLHLSIELTPDDTTKVNQLLTVYKLSIRNRPIRTDILDRAYKLAKTTNYNKGIALALNYKGLNYRYNNKYLKAIQYHKEAIAYFDKTDDILSKIKNYNSLAVAYRRMNIEQEAIKYYLKALKLAEDSQHLKSIAISLNGIGNSYINLKRYDDALTYFKMALKLEELNKNTRGISYDYSNIGEVYMYKEKFDSSYAYHLKSLEIAKKTNYKDNVAIIYNTLGQMFQHSKQYHKSIEYFEKAIPILRNYKSKRYLSNSLINLGVSQTAISSYQEAKINIEEGLSIAKEISSKENIILGYKALSNLYRTQNKFKDALDDHLTMIAFRDSIFNLDNENSIKALELKYETEKKDEQIAKLSLEAKVQKSKIIIQFMAIAILIILTISIFIFNKMRIKNKNLELEDMRNKIEKHLEQISLFEKNDTLKDGIDVKEKYGLSDREDEVLKYISQGLKNQEIADKMFVSLSTIKTHTKNIFDKLDVRNRIEAARKAKSL